MRRALSLVLVLAACGSPAAVPFNDTGECDLVLEGRDAMRYDLLIVLDGSPASAALAGRTIASLGRELRSVWPWGADPRALAWPPWIHVAFAGPDGALLAPAGAPSFLDWRPWLPNGGLDVDLEGELAARAALARPTRRGPAPLDAALAAVRRERAQPTGFLRPWSALPLVLATAGDDHSRLEPKDAYAELRDAVMAEQFSSRYALHLTPLQMACDGMPEQGPRLRSFYAQDPYALMWDLCRADVGPLRDDRIIDFAGPCMPEPLGALELCVVIDRTTTSTGVVQRRMPLCDGTVVPCFRFETSKACPPGEVTMVVDRGATYLAPPNTETLAACECAGQ
jgi:hypothetical protein